MDESALFYFTFFLEKNNGWMILWNKTIFNFPENKSKNFKKRDDRFIQTRGEWLRMSELTLVYLLARYFQASSRGWSCRSC